VSTKVFHLDARPLELRGNEVQHPRRHRADEPSEASPLPLPAKLEGFQLVHAGAREGLLGPVEPAERTPEVMLH